VVLCVLVIVVGERELEVITEFSKEVADTTWTKLLPKIKLLSAKEAGSRTGLWEVLTKQRGDSNIR